MREGITFSCKCIDSVNYFYAFLFTKAQYLCILNVTRRMLRILLLHIPKAPTVSLVLLFTWVKQFPPFSLTNNYGTTFRQEPKDILIHLLDTFGNLQCTSYLSCHFLCLQFIFQVTYSIDNLVEPRGRYLRA